MVALKYSRQRECIQNYLTSSCDHPTADMVYMHVKNEFPNISLGTVYRNLNLLTEIGAALKINTPNGGHRYDGQIGAHNHFICTDCGCIVDLEVNDISNINTIQGESFSGIVESHSTVFFGKCSECITKS
ncbi:MAG: transcriptional repressor [Eubacteriales bacterium]